MRKIETIDIDQAINLIAPLNPALSKIISEQKLNAKHKIYKVSYNYGDLIVKKNLLQVPNALGDLVPIDHHTINSKIASDLSYNRGSNPVSVILNKSAELSIDLATRRPPYKKLVAGELFGTWWLLDGERSYYPGLNWQLSAGTNTIFTLPKISRDKSYKQLAAEYNIIAPTPNGLEDHFNIFKKISSNTDWQIDILFFNGEWFNGLDDKPRWHRYLLNDVWQNSSHLRNETLWHFVYESLKNESNIKNAEYSTAIISHILSIATGALLGLAPSTNEEDAPIKSIQHALIHSYNLQKYHPIIFTPQLINSDPVYYSLQFPATFKVIKRKSDRYSVLYDLYDVKVLLNKIISKIKNGNLLDLKGTHLYNIIGNIDFKFYHNDSKTYIEEGILHPDKLAEYDNRFKNMSIPSNAKFLRGCIGISSKNK